MEPQELKIIITVRPDKGGESWSSTHELVNITEYAAGIILIDIGRDLLAALASHHHSHEHATEEATNGH